MFRKFLKSFGLGLLLVLIVGIVALLTGRAVVQHRISARTRIVSPGGIASLEKVDLGGVAQWISIRGHDRARPILLFLHGGPGLPEMSFAYMNAALEKDFVVVQWDQRGAGKSFASGIPPASMNLEQFIADARQLAESLERRFGQKRIFLVGHSTGSVIGLILAARAPQLFRAYVGISQVANLQESEKFLYRFALESATERDDHDAVAELERIGAPPFATAKQLQVSQKWVNKFASDKLGKMEPGRLELAFFSPACSLLDFWRIARGAKFSFDHLWRELFSVDLFKEAPRVNLPVYFLEGRHDRIVTGEVAEKYFQALAAPRGKQFIWFEKSAHWPQLEESEKFRQVMVDRVLKEN